MSLITESLAKLASQYQDSTKFKAYIASFLTEFEALAASRLQLLNERWLNTAEGVQLDGIGEIVGIKRPQIPIALVDLFGFSDDVTALGFGSDIDPEQGGQFYDIMSPSTVLANDAVYLVSIRGKIIQNRIAMTVEETLELLSFMVGGALVRYYLNGNLNPVYEIYKMVTPAEAEAIKLLPSLLGVGDIVVYVSGDPRTFGFSDDLTAFGFGSDTDATQGGYFSKILI